MLLKCSAELAIITSSMFFSLSSMYLLVSKERSENPEKLAAESTLQPNGGVRLGELEITKNCLSDLPTAVVQLEEWALPKTVDRCLNPWPILETFYNRNLRP